MGQSPPGPQGIQGPQGVQGPQGPKGESITDISVQNGIFKVTTSSGEVFQAPAGGPPGPQGVGIKSIGLDNSDGSLKFNLTDGTSSGISTQFTSNLLESNTLWCGGTSGNLCVLPPTKKGIDWGYGGSRIIDNNELTVYTDNNLKFNIANTSVGQMTKDGLYYKGRDILGELDELKKKTQKFNNDGNISSDRINIGDWSIITDSWSTDDGNKAMYFKKIVGNNQGDKMIIKANGDITSPPNDVSLQYKTVKIGDWRATGTWWGDDNAARALIIGKKDGQNSGDKILIKADGSVEAVDNFYSRRWQKWL